MREIGLPPSSSFNHGLLDLTTANVPHSNPEDMMKHITPKRYLFFTLFSILLLIGLTACRQEAAPTTEFVPADEQPASNDAAQTQADTPAEVAAEQAPVEQAPVEQAPVEQAPAEQAPAEQAPAEQAPAEEMASAGPRAFQIVPESSEVRFIISEVLRGQPKTVVGATSDFSGEIQIDPANPAQTQISTIEINAGNFVTDSTQRNGAIRRFILQSSQHPTITFEPTSIEGLPASATAGESFDFRVTGDLTIRDISQPVTFDMTVTANSENELSGLGSATVQRGDYSLTIPSVPSVAGVSEEVRLEIEFVAQAN
jgi:polyisoprenoid-binding protein YceI